MIRLGGRRDRASRRSSGSLQLAALGAAAAALVAYLLASGQTIVAVTASLLPIVAWVLAQPVALLVPLGASLPDIRSLTGGRGGFHISISDIVLVLVGAGILVESAITRPVPFVRVLRPVLVPVLQYGAVMVLLLVLHLGANEFAQTAQRFELFLLPLIVGAYAALKDKHMRLLQAYVVASTGLAIVWPLYDFGMQKNPVGQMIANAILLLVAVQRLRGLLPCLLVLVPGLILTQSRGAIIAAAIGVVVILMMHGFRGRAVPARALAGTVVAAAAFALAPAALQERVTTLSASQNSPAGWNVYFRDQYSEDARQIIREHPWTGVGIGNYLEASSFSPWRADDPHQVILLQAAEGGYVFAASFVLLAVGTLVALRRMRHVDVGIAAAAVMASTVAHGMVDVYWVRGTPVLSWLLVGMACAGMTIRRAELERS